MDDLYRRVAASFDAQGLMTTLGARLETVADSTVEITMPFSASLSQQHGYVHAGAITSILDSACGYAALTKAPAGHEVVTAEFKINFVRPAIGERFVALGRVQTSGNMLSVATGEVSALNEGTWKVVAIMQATIVSIAAKVEQVV